MQRVDAPEILDSGACSLEETRAALSTIANINRRFGGVATTYKMVERAAKAAGHKRLSMLEVGAGRGEVPEIVRENLAKQGIQLDVTLLDLAQSHLPPRRGVVANAMQLPFLEGAFDFISCNLLAHHLSPEQLKRFVHEALRVCRKAVLINDLVRHPLHLALVYISSPIMGSHIAWLDGLTSVRRAYLPEEMRRMITEAVNGSGVPQIEISRHYLYRMGVTVWKQPTTGKSNRPTA